MSNVDEAIKLMLAIRKKGSVELNFDGSGDASSIKVTTKIVDFDVKDFDKYRAVEQR